jgi:hypothetical protein
MTVDATAECTLLAGFGACAEKRRMACWVRVLVSTDVADMLASRLRMSRETL